MRKILVVMFWKLWHVTEEMMGRRVNANKGKILRNMEVYFRKNEIYFFLFSY
jgi:hypothetical protein